MALRPILTFPDPRLALKAKPVTEVTDDIRQLIDDMFETMYHAEGIGLAAPQIGVLSRVIVVDCGARESEERPLGPIEPIAIVNPIITCAEGQIVWEEGCLSVPGYTDEVERPSKVCVEGLDADGKPLVIEAENSLLAVCLQHEIDHLEGTLFVDHLSRLKQQMVKKRLKKKAREEAAV